MEDARLEEIIREIDQDNVSDQIWHMKTQIYILFDFFLIF